MILSGRQRSNYRLLGLVGNGQYGRVYCAIHRKTGQLVAIKHMHRHSLPTHAFLQELHCLLSLDHPNIVACHALEHSDEDRLLVLEYCIGGTLRSQMLHPLSRPDIFNLITDILRGLAHAHQRGIVHCDVKPENILLNYDDGRWRAKISDFGIAKLVQDQEKGKASGQTGSPAYMAPERFYRRYSPSADVYAVGIILFELLVGHRPFSGAPMDLRSAHLNDPVPRVEQLVGPLKRIVGKALEKLPARRYPTAVEMLTDLQQLDAISPKLMMLSPESAMTEYHVYDGSPIAPLTSPVSHLDEFPGTVLRTELVLPKAEAENGAIPPSPPVILAQGAQLTLRPLAERQLIEQYIFDSPIRGISLSTAGMVVSTAYGVWCGPRPNQLEPIAQWTAPAMVTVAPHHRWFAVATPQLKQLAIASIIELQKPRRILGRRTFQPQVQCPLPGDLLIHQLLTVDVSHVAMVGQTNRPGSQLQVWTRRGSCVGYLDLGIMLRQLTPTRPPHQWIAVDAHSPETVIFLTLRPVRMTCLRLDICPTLMLDLPWGYLFGDIQGRLLLLDRDLQPIGGIQGPAGATAIASISAHEILVATWQNDQGALHQLNLQDFALDMIF